MLVILFLVAGVLNVTRVSDAASVWGSVSKTERNERILQFVMSKSTVTRHEDCIVKRLKSRIKLFSMKIDIGSQWDPAKKTPFITKCRAADEECIKKNAVTAIPLFGAGIPELGVETLDPTYIEFLDGSKPNLKFFLRNITITGLSNTIPLQIRRDVSKSKLFLKLECAVECRGLYEMSGNVLAIKIQGEGPLHVKIHFIIDFDVDLEEVTGKDSKKYLSIRKFEYTYNLIGKSEVSFENIFPDNEVLRKATMEVIKNNGNDVVKEIGDAMFRASATKNVKNINNFFKALPIEDFSIDN